MIDFLPSERDREGIALASRGLADGMGGAPLGSESPLYGEAYARGQLVRRVERGDVMLSMYEGSRCPRCDAHFVGFVGACGCEEPGDKALVRGAYVLRGPNAMATGFRFMTAGELRVLIATGIPLLDVDGADISCQIQLPQ